MTCQDLKPLLSEYLDAALDAEAAGAVRGHLSLCSGCSREFELLRGVGRLLRELPPKPLPSGFMTKLRARRGDDSSPADLFLPRRAFAYGLAALIAGMVVIRAAKPRPGPARPDAENLAEVAQPPAPRTRAAPFRDVGEPLVGDGGPQEAPLLPKATGAPAYVRQNPAYDNEAQAQRMKRESARLGIKSINPEQEEQPSEPFLGRRLGSPDVREHADAHVEQLVAMRHAVEQSNGKPKPVPILGATAPLLYEKEKDETNGQAIEDAAGSSRTGLWQGDFSGGNEGTRTVNDLKSWQQLWKTLSPALPAPGIDFARQEIVAVFLGSRPSGGFAVEIVEVKTSETVVLVRWRERTPTPGVPAPEGSTTPYALSAVAKSDLPVRFEKTP